MPRRQPPDSPTPAASARTRQRGAAHPAPRRTGPAPRRRGKRRRGFAFWQYLFLAAVGFFTICAAIGVGVFISFVNSSPPIETLEQYDPPEITRVYDRDGAMVIGDFKSENRQVVGIKDIPVRLRNAFIAIEDERFYNHFGIDVIGIVGVLFNFFTSGELRGASTITQQMARNVLKEVGRDVTVQRKIREAVASIQIEHRYSKDQILEFYLNHIEFNHNSYGIKAAAATNFSKELDELTVAECALLAALPKSPTLYNPFRNPERAIQRRNLVIESMHKLNMIDEEAYQSALNEPLRLNRSYKSVSKYPFFVDGLQRDLRGNYNLRDQQLNEAGLRITASIDPEIQEVCEEVLREGLVEVEKKWQAAKEARLAREYKSSDEGGMGGVRSGQTRLGRILKVDEQELRVQLDRYRGTIQLPAYIPYYNPDRILKAGQLIDIKINELRNDGTLVGELGDSRPVQGSIVVLDAHSGEVLSLVGGTNFYDKATGWFNRAVQGGRQPGSCFKPFVFAEALNKGWGPNSIVIDEPIEYPMAVGAPYRPRNYERNQFFGPTTLIEALEHSRNIVTLRLFEALRVRPAVQNIKEFDFTGNGDRWEIPPHISVSLGTIDVSPLQLAAAYQVFANLGVASRPQFFRSIVDPRGRVQIPRKDKEEQIISPIAAFQMQYIMRQVVLYGTGRSEIGSKFPTPRYPVIAGKTGTTNDNIDAWFAGFTPDLVIVCDVGFDDRKSLGPKMTGGKVAGPIWAAAFKGIMEIPGRTWQKTFDAPAVDIEYVNICAKSGKRAGEWCGASDHRIYPLVPFGRGQGPNQVCDGSGGTVAPLIAPVGPNYAWEAGIALTTGFARPSSIYDYGTDGGDDQMEEPLPDGQQQAQAY